MNISLEEGNLTKAKNAARQFARWGGPIVDVEAEAKAMGVCRHIPNGVVLADSV